MVFADSCNISEVFWYLFFQRVAAVILFFECDEAKEPYVPHVIEPIFSVQLPNFSKQFHLCHLPKLKIKMIKWIVRMNFVFLLTGMAYLYIELQSKFVWCLFCLRMVFIFQTSPPRPPTSLTPMFFTLGEFCHALVLLLFSKFYNVSRVSPWGLRFQRFL